MPAVLVVVALAIAYRENGGFDGQAQPVIAGLLATAVVASWLVGSSVPGDLQRALGWTGSALCLWVVISAAANRGIGDAAGSVALLLGMAAVVVAARGLDVGDRDLVAAALVALGCVVAMTGWIGLVGAHHPWVSDEELRRAATTLTYPNAAAGLLVPLAMVAIGLAPYGQVAGHIGCCLLVAGVIATLSRAGAIAFVVGLVVLSARSGWRLLLRGSAPGLLGAGITIAGLTPTFTGAPDSPWRPLLALGLGLLVTTILACCADMVLGGATLIGITAVLAGVTHGAADFLVAGGRWKFSEPYRRESIPAALELGVDHPLFGTGPGRAVISWRNSGDEVLMSRFVHNEFAQSFAELGAIGLLLVVALIGRAGFTLWRAREDCPVPGLRAGSLAALAAFSTHSLADFLWRLPALPLTIATLVGLSLPEHRAKEPSCTNN